jgi:hypothetical protein
MPKHYIRGIGGAVVGAALGVLLYWVFLRRGIVVPLLAPGLTGLGAGLAVGRRAWGVGAIAAALAVVTAVLTDAVLLPFVADPSILYFLAHLHQLPPFHLAGAPVPMMAIYLIGGLAAFYFGIGRSYLARRAAGADTKA